MTEPEGRVYGTQPTEDEPINTEENFEDRMSQAVTEIKSRLNRLEEPTPRPEEWAQSVRLLERVTALENGSRLVGTGDLIAQIMQRLEALETSEVQDDLLKLGELQARLNRLEGHARGISVGVVQGAQIRPEDVRAAESGFVRGEGPDTMYMTPPDLNADYKRGFAQGFDRGRIKGQEEGRQSALTNHGELKRVMREGNLRSAEIAVASYMGNHFSEATICGVINALREGMTPDLMDHTKPPADKETSEPIRRVGEVEATVTRPVRDNPQA